MIVKNIKCQLDYSKIDINLQHITFKNILVVLKTFVFFSLLIHLASWSDWTQYGSCSRTCGGGVKNRQRTCFHAYLSNYEAPGQCNGSASESQSCNNQTCRKLTLYLL